MEMKTQIFLLALVGASLASSSTGRNWNQGTQQGRKDLFSVLFHQYYAEVNPDDLRVNMSILLQSFKVDEDRNILETDVWISREWNDKRLKWTHEETRFYGAAVLRVNSSRVWKPDLSLYNSADSAHQMNCWDSQVVLQSNGDLSWITPCKLKSYCNYTLKASPYQLQTCELKFGSWTYDGNAMDLQIKNNDNKIGVTTLTTPPGWELLSTGAKRNSVVYSCCQEPYIDITYNMTLRRVPPLDQIHYKNLI